MTFSDLRGHSPTASLLNVILYSCAAIDQISTVTARCAVHLRYRTPCQYLEGKWRLSNTRRED